MPTIQCATPGCLNKVERKNALKKARCYYCTVDRNRIRARAAYTRKPQRIKSNDRVSHNLSTR